MNISTIDLVWGYVALLAPLLMAAWWKLGIGRSVLIATVRMSLQLYLMGFYLGFIFQQNSAWLNFLWLGVMVLAANFSAVREGKLPLRKFFLPGLAASMLSFGVTLLIFIGLVIRPEPFYDAQYLIPISGMILGNTLRGNIIALERFADSIAVDERNYINRLLLGATFREAVFPYFQNAVRATIAPTVGSMATVGLVTMPGMMTGQMLGGELPMEAIKYQLVILLAIFFAMFFSAALGIVFCRSRFFDANLMLTRK